LLFLKLSKPNSPICFYLDKSDLFPPNQAFFLPNPILSRLVKSIKLIKWC